MKQLTILPLLGYAVLLGYAGYATVVIGHWPYYAHPDPKDLPGPTLLRIVSGAMAVSLAMVVALPIGYAIRRAVAAWKKQSLAPHPAPLLIYGAGALVWILDLAAEFTPLPWSSLTSWMLD